MKKRMGRPPKAKAERKTKLVQLRMSGAEYRVIASRAKAAGLSVSEYLRERATRD